MVAGEAFDLHYRDIMECIKALFGDPELSEHLILAPEQHYVDKDQTIRHYCDLYTGKWWWSTQKEIEKERPGATIIPVIISSDKTQVTLFRNKAAYPIYMTIGNIPKHIRRKVSNQTQVLIGYLPTTKLEHITSDASRRRTIANLYHASVQYILKPLEEAGATGVPIKSGAGSWHQCHPLYAIFSGDYQEQVLSTMCKYTECPKCDIDHKQMGEGAQAAFNLRDPNTVLDALESFDPENPGEFIQNCKEAKIKPIVNPFWKNLPYSDPFQAICPDLLHQVFQGLVKYLVAWLTKAYGATELDARCRRLPPNHHIRLFMKGITHLSHLSGKEHKQICSFLLGLVIDAPCQEGDASHKAKLLRTVVGALNFIYLAQYPCHTDATLQLLEEELQDFNSDRDVLIELGIREDFNIMKLHFFEHYRALIELFGPLDGVNTEYFERLHIDFVKEAYRATNHKDEYWQMVLWLERKEKILRHTKYINWLLHPHRQDNEKKKINCQPKPAWQLRMTKHPSIKSVSIETVIREYGAVHFREAFARFIITTQHTNITSAELEKRAEHITLPTRNLPVYHRIKFIDPSSSQILDSIHVQPKKICAHNREMPARFDTALINDGRGQKIGVKGYRVAQVRVVFTLPDRVKREFPPECQAALSQHLAYVEWFTNFPSKPELNHKLYKLKRSYIHGDRLVSIIPVRNIARSVHLFPKFGRVAQREWTWSTVLEKCSTFFVNSFSDPAMYVFVV